MNYFQLQNRCGANSAFFNVRSSCGRCHIDVATAPNIFCSWSLLVAWNLRKKSFKSFWQLIFFSRPQNQTRSTNKRHRIPTLWRSARDFGQRKKYFNKYPSINNKCRDCTSQNLAQTYVACILARGVSNKDMLKL